MDILGDASLTSPPPPHISVAIPYDPTLHAPWPLAAPCLFALSATHCWICRMRTRLSAASVNLPRPLTVRLQPQNSVNSIPFASHPATSKPNHSLYTPTHLLPNKELGQVEIVTTSAEKPAPRWYQELAAAAKPHGEGEDGNDEGGDSRHAKVDEPCPKCGHPEMSFYTMQLRSADEGSTVFYECLSKKCGHKYSQNN